jgi:hypothetical protein
MPAPEPQADLRKIDWLKRTYLVDGKSVEVKEGEADFRVEGDAFVPVDSAEISERGMPEIQSMDRYGGLKVKLAGYVDIDGDGHEDAVIERELIWFEGPNADMHSSLEVYTAHGHEVRVLTAIPEDGWPGMIEKVELSPGRVALDWFAASLPPKPDDDHHEVWTWHATGLRREK